MYVQPTNCEILATALTNTLVILTILFLQWGRQNNNKKNLTLLIKM